MMTNKQFLFSIVATALVTSLLTVLAYHILIQPEQIIYEQTKGNAVQAAERDIQFSERFDKLYKSTVPTDFTKAAKDSREAVVFIRSLTKISENPLNRNVSSMTGSGVAISRDGYIVTNHHVIEKAEQVEVTLNNNKEYKAQIVGIDPQTDLAVLKIEADPLPYMIFGNSDSLLVGEWVLAVGNPFRLQSTVTAGIVSAKARNINVLEDRSGIESFIQTDAAVNPGNSGGALINTKGELIGINTAILSESGNYEGFSFAIPANLAKKIASDIMQYGAVQRGWMGVEIAPITADMAEEIGLEEVAGVLITMVTNGSGAQDAGLQSGDILLSVNQEATNTLPEFMEQIGTYRPGDVITVKVFRNGQMKNIAVTLKNRLNSTDFVAVRKDKVLTDMGFELRDLSSNEKQRNEQNGVIVVSVYRSSKVGRANIEPGYIITSCNGSKVNNVQQLVEKLKNATGTIRLQGYYENYPGEFPYEFEK